MRGFIYKSTKILPSGKISMKLTTNPKIAEKLGGVLTCRSSFSVHPISKFSKNLSAKKNGDNITSFLSSSSLTS